MQNIQQVEPKIFRVWWDEQPNESLTVNFAPFAPWVRGHYCLLHWQAKPKGLRRWGVYDSATDRYLGVDWCCLQIESVTCRTLQVDERVITTVPTAVLYLPGARITGETPVIIGRAR